MVPGFNCETANESLSRASEGIFYGAEKDVAVHLGTCGFVVLGQLSTWTYWTGCSKEGLKIVVQHSA